MTQNYRYLAVAAIHREDWTAACEYAQQAWDWLAQVPEDHHWKGLYLLTRAKAQLGLGDRDEAIRLLEEAHQLGDHGHSQVYTEVLEELRQIYRSLHRYLEAFRLKQERQSIEQQYGIRAFVGAGRLQPKREDREALAQPLRLAPDQDEIALEIRASGRQKDLDQLLERIGRNDHKLIVIHGYSGVGKSSLVNAGLVAALKQKPIALRRNLPIVVRTYTDWERELGRLVAEAIGGGSAAEQGESVLDNLRWLEGQNRRSVLIFDQFEEFFFVYPQPEQRRSFFRFLAECLQILSVKVVLALREDYLHFLLECNQLPEMDRSGIDILSRNARYGLGNFAPTDAAAIIDNLTQRARFYLEPELRDALVADLAGELGQVRPIELQIVGAQLQADNITTLANYRQLGENPKQMLVERYLAEVVNDCGEEHSRLAELVLYLLTDEKGTRPLKTRTDLEKELQALAMEPEPEQLNLVLEILVGSGLVMFLPEVPEDRYQLVHDYLAAFIRDQRMPIFLEELATARQQKAQSEAQLRQTLVQLEDALKQEQTARQQAEQLRISAEKKEIEALCKSSEALFASNQMFDALLESLRAAAKLKQAIWMQGEAFHMQDNGQIKFQIEKALRQSVYAVKEFNRFETPDFRSLPPLAKGILTLNIATTTASGRETPIVWSVCFSPNGQFLATASNDGTVKIWTINGALRKILSSSSISSWVRFSPDSQLLASAHDDSSVRLWKLDGSLIAVLEGHKDEISQVCFSPDGEIIASASYDGTIKLWSLDGVLLLTIPSHSYAVKAVSFSPDGKSIVTASNVPQDSAIRFWDRKGELLANLPERVTRFCFCLDGKNMLLSNGSSTVKLIELDGSLIRTFETHSQQVFDISVSPDEKMLATANSEGTVTLWDLEGTMINTLPHRSSVNDVSFNPDGQILASACIDGRVSLWKTENPLRRIIRGKKNQWFQSLCFSPDSKFFATGDNNGNVQFWSPSGLLLSTIKAHEDRISTVRISSDSQKFITTSFDKTIKLWRIDGTLVRTLQHNEKVWNVEFSPDEQMFVGGGTETAVRLWHQDGRLLNEMRNQGGQHSESVSFSPDGQLIAVGTTGGTIDLWKPDGTFVQSLKGHGRAVMSVTFSPDGEFILSASRDNTAKIWSRDGELRRTFQGHRNWVLDAKFSPDGKVFATASFDRTIRIWSLWDKVRGEKNGLLAEFQGHEDLVWEICFSPDGKTLASASRDGTVILWNWNLQLDELITHGCNWLYDYVQTNPKLDDSDRQLYDFVRQQSRDLE